MLVVFKYSIIDIIAYADCKTVVDIMQDLISTCRVPNDWPHRQWWCGILEIVPVCRAHQPTTSTTACQATATFVEKSRST